MSSNSTKYGAVSILVHWLIALATTVLLGLGLYLHASPTTTDERAFLSDLHISLGLTTAALVLFAIMLRLAIKGPPYPESAPRWRQLAGAWLHVLIYLGLIVIAVSGYLRLVFAGAPINLWAAPLPPWGEPNDQYAEWCAQAHEIAAYGLCVLIVAHIALVTANSIMHRGFSRRMLLGDGVASELVPASELKADDGGKIARDLARKMRFLGWAGFWLQFIFAFLSALLLQFATAGRALSAVTSSLGDAIYWSGCALVFLLLTCALSFYYTGRAKRLAANPERYLGGREGSGFWYLRAGMIFGLLGVLSSFGGVALSIILLIAKTVSQPPGIAITDPTKIIRALDVFVLLMSFLLLMAHFIGGGISLWLRIAFAKARMKYGAAKQQAADEAKSPSVVI